MVDETDITAVVPPQLKTPEPFWTCRARPQDTVKTIVITGVPRGGTTFGASLVSHLGVPFSGLGEEDRVGSRYSHAGLMGTFGTEEFAAHAREIDRGRDVWAFKHPAAISQQEFVINNVRNPHLIIVFKEPLSVAMRAISIKEKDMADLPKQVGSVLKHYLEAVQFVESSALPILLLSYDRAMRDLPAAVEGVGEFLGKEDFDPVALADMIAGDQDRYFKMTRRRQVRRGNELGGAGT